MDTNANQFARLGFPWFDATPEPQVPLSKASRKIRKAGPRMATVKPEFREEGYVRRALSAEEQRAAKHRDMLAEVRRAQRDQRVLSQHWGKSDTAIAARVAPSETAEQRARAAEAAAQWRAEQEAREAARRAERQAERDAEAREAFAELADQLAEASKNWGIPQI